MNRLFSALALILFSGLFGPAPVWAQNLFAPVVRINDGVITEFEVQQRLRFLQVLNAPGASRPAVIQNLIDDRLKLEATSTFGIEVNPEQLQAGLERFASQANISAAEFIQRIGQVGVEPETFRDFIAVNQVWADLIRGRFGNRVQISEADIDRALAAARGTSSLRVLLSEIIIPAPPPRLEQVRQIADQISQSQSEAEFSSFARRYSATRSKGAGGRLPWTPLTQLPESLRPIILSLSPGEVTAPLPIPNAIALFQLRDIEETGVNAPEFAAIEYAALYLPGGRSEQTLARAAAIEDRVDQCDDLYGVNRGQPEENLDRGSLPPAEIPQDIAIELSKLDPGEVSTTLTRANGQTLVFLMLCGRTPELEEELDRDTIVNGLRDQRLQGFADSYLESLRSDATILRLN